MYERNCTKKRLNFYVKNVYIWNSTLLYNLENPKNPIMGQPIVAGYNWILKPTSIFVGHHLKSFYSKFKNILNDSLSLINLLGKTKIDNDCFLFTVDFQNLYSNISVKDALELLKRLFFKYLNVIPNAHLIIELMELVLNSAVMEFQKVFYRKILGNCHGH